MASLTAPVSPVDISFSPKYDIKASSPLDTYIKDGSTSPYHLQLSSPAKRSFDGSDGLATFEAHRLSLSSRSVLNCLSGLPSRATSPYQTGQDDFTFSHSEFFAEPGAMNEEHDSYSGGTSTYPHEDDLFSSTPNPTNDIGSSLSAQLRHPHMDAPHDSQIDPTLYSDVASDVPSIPATPQANLEWNLTSERFCYKVTPPTPVTAVSSSFGSSTKRRRKEVYCDYKDCTRHTKPFSSDSDLRRHKEGVHGEQQENTVTYICEECKLAGRLPRPCTRKDNFRIHCQTKHGEVNLEKLIIRSRKVGLQPNLDLDTPSKKPRYDTRCRFCTHDFKRRSDLKRHLLEVHNFRSEEPSNLLEGADDHNGPSQFVHSDGTNASATHLSTIDCPYPGCPKTGKKAFRRFDKWRNHLSAKHDISRLECPYGACPNLFDLVEIPCDYERHVRVHHKENLPSKRPNVPASEVIMREKSGEFTWMNQLS